MSTPTMMPTVGSWALTTLELDSGAAASSTHEQLGAALTDALATPSSVAYRLAYQRHRRGGAVGNAGDASHGHGPTEMEPILSEGTLGNGLLEEALLAGGGGVFGANEMYDSERGYHALLQWRMSYQAHRAGASRGAKGEIGAGLSGADVRMLPVARLASHTRQLSVRAKRETTRLAALKEVAEGGEGLQSVAERVRPVHVHVGAGRLGLGLVLPALARQCKDNSGALIVLQRPSEAWSALQDGTVAEFTVNKEHVCSLRVVRTASAEASAILKADSELDGLLVLSEEEALLDELAASATTLSCSLGPALASGLGPLAQAIRRVDIEGRGGRLRLYAAENDHAAVEKLAVTPVVEGGLEGMPIKVIPLLVDRVCTTRTITESQIDTAAEAWPGEIVVMTPPVEADDGDDEAFATGEAAPMTETVDVQRRRLLVAPPFSGAGVRWPKSTAEAHFLHRKKILTVNGTHTTLAFHALAVHEPPPHMGLPVGDHELLRAVADEGADAADDEAAQDAALQVEETYRMAWSWVVARQLLLLYESDAEVARAALGCTTDAEVAEALLAGARIAINRLGKGGDTTKRVLGGGVVNRFQTRLKPIASFLDASTGGSASSRWLHGALPRQVLRRAKLTETAMRLAVLGLAADAERFTVDTKAAEVDPAK